MRPTVRSDCPGAVFLSSASECATPAQSYGSVSVYSALGEAMRCMLRPVKAREPNVKGPLHRNPLNLAACEGVKGIVQTNYIEDLVTVSTVSLIYKSFYSNPFTPSPVAKIKGLYRSSPSPSLHRASHLPLGGDDLVANKSSERRREQGNQNQCLIRIVWLSPFTPSQAI
jgi:hypothetical protein